MFDRLWYIGLIIGKHGIRRLPHLPACKFSISLTTLPSDHSSSYIVAYVWLWILKVVRVSSSLVTQLRSLNFLQGTIALYLISRQLLFDIPRFETSTNDETLRSTSARSCSPIGIDHATLNICLFPPLFFFYSLFYTDVTSTVLVLLAYMDFHLDKGRNQYFLSIAALFLRQTNIFWTAIYLGGLEVLRNLPKGRSEIEFPCKSTLLDVVTGSWQHACLYDPLIEDAWFEGLGQHVPVRNDH